jgi:hypothetical protein
VYYLDHGIYKNTTQNIHKNKAPGIELNPNSNIKRISIQDFFFHKMINLIKGYFSMLFGIYIFLI